MNMLHVFISYRHQQPDQQLAEKLASCLLEKGCSVFIDTKILWGVDWSKIIYENLERADFLVVLLSRESASSENVIEEIVRARELAQQRQGKPVILPIRVHYPFDEPLPYHVNAFLRTIQQQTWNGDDDTPKIVQLLMRRVAGDEGWEGEVLPNDHTRLVKGRVDEPSPYFDPRVEPGGALDVETDLYVVRSIDEETLLKLRQKRGFVVIRGPRQIGKTSLMMRAFTALTGEGGGMRGAYIDFQFMEIDRLRDQNSVWLSLAMNISRQIKLKTWDAAQWNPAKTHNENFLEFVDHGIFSEGDTPLIVCMDETERIFGTNVQSGFFGTLRGYFNQSAMDQNLKNIRWLLATSSEPSFFIQDLNQSPFNIGTQYKKSSFDAEEIQEFSEKLGIRLPPGEVDWIYEYVGGRPYLTHLLLFNIGKKPELREDFYDAATAGKGIFRDHLSRYFLHFQREPNLATTMKDVVYGKGCKDGMLADRLEGAGLVQYDETLKVVPACRLYAEFFKNVL